jgi:hypothetical protein
MNVYIYKKNNILSEKNLLYSLKWKIIFFPIHVLMLKNPH